MAINEGLAIGMLPVLLISSEIKPVTLQAHLKPMSTAQEDCMQHRFLCVAKPAAQLTCPVPSTQKSRHIIGADFSHTTARVAIMTIDGGSLFSSKYVI